MAIKGQDRLIVALDVPRVDQARDLVARLGGAVRWYKIGMELVFSGEGLPLARELTREGKHVFLDMKLLDIPNTVAAAVANIARLGVAMTTLHAYPQTMRAAAEAAAGTELKLLGVSVLTSFDQDDLAQTGYALPLGDLVERRARQAREAGVHGIVCSPAEVAQVRRLVGPEFRIVVPGIRPQGAVAGDQKRVASPRQAIREGASHVVVGRPITQAENPLAAAKAIIQEIESA
ncbi:orotidine-5'-phosphate decarboxylase [Lutibaculum baratangense]|uniref:Orotidine 5'-phosphate decarboxylase n=1 Tax=Lutibaculum baratangense AMV1 TaxID=631454 RepID=V4TJK1_9HYPH|nr:Orotidine 5'-phosphate decarboxylase [Lutibaculum baratangense AMV1]